MMLSSLLIRIKRALHEAVIEQDWPLLKAFLISLVLHSVLLLIFGPSFGLTMRHGVPEPTAALNAVLVSNRNLAEINGLDSTDLESELPDPVGSAGQSKLSGTELGGERSSEVVYQVKPEARVESERDKRVILSENSFGLGLSRPPQLLNEISVEYPAAAGTKDGKLVLRIAVGETGAIESMQILKADPPGLFEEAALKAFSRAEFAPGQFLGLPVRSHFVVEVDFLPVSRDSTSGRGY